MSNPPQIEIVSPSNLPPGLAEALQAALAAKSSSKPVPMTDEDVTHLHIKAVEDPALKLWDVVQLRPEFDCTQPTLHVETDYVVVRILDRPHYHIDRDTGITTVVDCTVGIKQEAGHKGIADTHNHFHYHEVGACSRHLTRIGSLKDPT